MLEPLELDSTAMKMFPLKGLREVLMKEAAYTEHGKVSRVLARGTEMTTLLTVAREGNASPQHAAPGPVTLAVLSGNVTLSTDGHGTATLDEGDAVSMSTGMPHTATANRDSTYLVVIGGKS